ncbi:MAG: hypothetical protein E7662_02395 [Ruminococcaceae bacterium]|nr:hypothetical protein [Oscillospiraceae bacterium]
MKKTVKTMAAVLTAVLLCTACSAPWSTFMMDEMLPPPIDEYTSLPRVEAVTLTRLSDGASVTVSGTDVELLYAAFENIACTRRKGGVTPVYSLSYSMTDGLPVLEEILLGEYRGTTCLSVGEYRYRPVSIELDMTYIENLFAEQAS